MLWILLGTNRKKAKVSSDHIWVLLKAFYFILNNLTLVWHLKCLTSSSRCGHLSVQIMCKWMKKSWYEKRPQSKWPLTNNICYETLSADGWSLVDHCDDGLLSVCWKFGWNRPKPACETHTSSNKNSQTRVSQHHLWSLKLNIFLKIVFLCSQGCLLSLGELSYVIRWWHVVTRRVIIVKTKLKKS